MKTWKHGIIAVIAFVAISCASTSKVSGLLSLDEAIETAVQSIEARIESGSEIAVYSIIALQYPETLGNYLGNDLNDKFTVSGRVKPLAREAALNYVDTEQQFQMSGLVSDESAVGIGHYLGAKVVISGTFHRYKEFSQLQLRAVDVRTSALVAAHTARIQNRDPVLRNITTPFGTVSGTAVKEDELAIVERGKEFLAQGKLDEAIKEFDKAIAANRKLSVAYFNRGTAYFEKGRYTDFIGDYETSFRVNYWQALGDHGAAARLDPNNWRAHYNLGQTRMAFIMASPGNKTIRDFRDVINSYTRVIQLEPNLFWGFFGRGLVYHMADDLDQAIADYTEAIRLDPNVNMLYKNRALVYHQKRDYDRAIADFTRAIQVNNDPEVTVFSYVRRGIVYGDKNDFERAKADWDEALRLDPEDRWYTRQRIVQALEERGW